MNATTARERDHLDLAERVEHLEADYGLLMALVGMLSSRVAELEGEAAPVDDNLTTLKGAAFTTGYSQSWIRKLIDDGRVSSTTIGRRVLVDKRTLPLRRGAK